MPIFKSVCGLFNKHDGTLRRPDSSAKPTGLDPTAIYLEKQVARNSSYTAHPVSRLKQMCGDLTKNEGRNNNTFTSGEVCSTSFKVTDYKND